MRSDEADHDLTGRQQLVWIEQQLAPEVPMNNLAMTFEIAGPLEPERFARAFDSVARERDALRTVIEERDGIPRQRALDEPPVTLALVDLSANPTAFGPWLDGRVTRAFDLSVAAYDTALVKLGPTRWIWLLCQHHTITDGRSFEVLYDLVARRYADPDAALPAAASYAEYRAAELAYRASAPAAAAAAFWSEKLAAPPELLHFYGELPHAEGPAVRRESIEVEPATRSALEALASKALEGGVVTDLTMTAFFAALLAAYVHRTSRSRRIAIGFPVQNRRTRPQRGTIGLLMEVQVLQIEVDPSESFAALLQRTHAELLGVLAHARYCNASNPFDVMLNYNPARFPAFAGWPTRVESLTGCSRMRSAAAGMPTIRASRRPRLVLQVQDFAGNAGHRLDFDLNAGAFAGDRAPHVASHFARLLDAVADSGRVPIRELPSLGDESGALLPPLDPGTGDGGAHHDLSAGASDPRPRVVAPRNDLELTIARAWSATLGVATIGVDDDFFDLGGHSFAALDLFRRLRHSCGVELPLAALFRAPTVARMAALIEEYREHGTPAWTTLVEIQGFGDLPPLYCAAGAGGNVTNLRRLAAHLGARQPFYGLQTRGVVGQREIPHGRVEEIARESLADMRRFQPQGPYYLAGYSAGGAVAFEMAQMLAREGDRVAALLLLDAYAPSIRSRTRRERARIHWERLRAVGPRYLALKVRDRAVGDAMRARELLRRLSAYLVPGRDQRERLLLRRRSQIQDLYAPEPSPGAGVLFRVERLPHQVRTRLALDETNGWRRYLLGGVTVVAVPGGHLDMCEEPHVQVLAARMVEVLAAARHAAEAAEKEEVE